MRTLFIDLETRSTVDLRKAGVYRYASDPSTEVLLASWCVDGGPVKTAPLLGAEWHDQSIVPLRAALETCDRIVAHNAGFERLLLTHNMAARFKFPVPPLGKWDCTAARAARMALPRNLDGAARALGLPVEKDREGHALMMRMCKPRQPRKGEDPEGTYWFDDEERMARLARYCETDVEVERLLDEYLPRLSEEETAVWQLNEMMNDRGVPLDIPFVNQARFAAFEAQTILNEELCQITKGAVPAASNVLALRRWLRDAHRVVLLDGDGDESTDKRILAAALKRTDLHPDARRAIEIRLEAGKSSVSKYEAMLNRVSGDGFARGNLIYHGASTGRFTGAGIQMQNMIRDVLPPSEFGALRDVLDTGGIPSLDVLSRALRQAIAVHEPCLSRLLWADYSAVEARGVAWLAGASELVGLFASGGKIYEEMAARIFDTTPDKIAAESFERFIGKQVVLGCGYGMGGAKFQANCTLLGKPVSADLANAAVKTFRETYPEIPALWRRLEQAAVRAVQHPGKIAEYGPIKFLADDRWLRLRLPSSRSLWYCKPRLVAVSGVYGEREVLEYDAVNPVTQRWGPERTWGGKLTENVVQGMCRDFTTRALLLLEDRGFNPILSVHDEIICLTPSLKYQEGLNVQAMIKVMCDLPPWAEGFPLKAGGKEGLRYGK